VIGIVVTAHERKALESSLGFSCPGGGWLRKSSIQKVFPIEHSLNQLGRILLAFS